MFSTRVHGGLDYLLNLWLLTMPWLLHFETGPEQWTAVVIGLSGIAYSLITNYELAIVRLLPMPSHLLLDLLSAILLGFSPWLFGFSERIIWPFPITAGFQLLIVRLSASEAYLTQSHRS